MKRTGEYSVVCAILNMWLTARALNIGMGWVSILKPKKINKIFIFFITFQYVAL